MSKGIDMAKEMFVSYGIDVDAVAGWLGSYGGEDSPCDISRGVFAGKVGSLRLLRMFEKWGIKTTWFMPGHSIESFWDEMKAVADAGHEVGMHGYSHENPIAMTPEQRRRFSINASSSSQSLPVRHRAATSRHGGNSVRRQTNS
jgi:peptidoglycan/xylan/chitin deacetylase (PgdA/CDA1 family)